MKYSKLLYQISIKKVNRNSIPSYYNSKSILDSIKTSLLKRNLKVFGLYYISKAKLTNGFSYICMIISNITKGNVYNLQELSSIVSKDSKQKSIGSSEIPMS